MNVSQQMSTALEAMEDRRLLTAEQMFRAVCLNPRAPRQARVDALHLLCKCMDRRGRYHASETAAVNIHRAWAEEVRRAEDARRERRTLATVAGGVGLFCLLVALVPGRRAA